MSANKKFRDFKIHPFTLLQNIGEDFNYLTDILSKHSDNFNKEPRVQTNV